MYHEPADAVSRRKKAEQAKEIHQVDINKPFEADNGTPPNDKPSVRKRRKTQNLRDDKA